MMGIVWKKKASQSIREVSREESMREGTTDLAVRGGVLFGLVKE